jgi:hypothetical protein
MAKRAAATKPGERHKQWRWALDIAIPFIRKRPSWVKAEPVLLHQIVKCRPIYPSNFAAFDSSTRLERYPGFKPYLAP